MTKGDELVRMDHARRFLPRESSKPNTIRSVENYNKIISERIQRRIFFSKQIVSYYRITRYFSRKEKKKKKKGKSHSDKRSSEPSSLFDKNVISLEIEIPNSMKFNFTTSGQILQKSFLRKI